LLLLRSRYIQNLPFSPIDGVNCEMYSIGGSIS
jgi:hypothetical protein